MVIDLVYKLKGININQKNNSPNANYIERGNI